VTSSDKHGRGGAAFTFHPFEVALCGYSGSGKTTLATKLLRRWKGAYRVGFVKHDAHRFEMDRPGKDTYEARDAGAAGVMINDPNHFAVVSFLPYSVFTRTSVLYDADFVLAEGFKYTTIPKLLLLDTDGRALREYTEGRFEQVLAIVGPAERPAEVDPDVPFFHRDDQEGIGAFIERHVTRRADAPLLGLVLVGGESRRMGRPKHLLAYGERPQAQRVVDMLGRICDAVYLSARADTPLEGMDADTRIVDRYPFRGPVAGILSAMHARPEAAWLVVACDLPFLDEGTIGDLETGRQPLGLATAYRSVHDGLPEPLCAIWEPRASQRLLQAAGLGLFCPRKVLIESKTHLLDLRNPRALDNVNTPDEFEEARERLSAGAAPGSPATSRS
jgi:molybdenum cofactor guanylyltransferase